MQLGRGSEDRLAEALEQAIREAAKAEQDAAGFVRALRRDLDRMLVSETKSDIGQFEQLAGRAMLAAALDTVVTKLLAEFSATSGTTGNGKADR